jgi:CubicO group peptidase (beta-lactamase class C family)
MRGDSFFKSLTMSGLTVILVMSTQDYSEQLNPPLDTAAINAYIQEAMTDYGVPGMSLAIVDDGELVYAQGYGVRDLRTGEPVTPETQFNIGSITKSFTALAAEQLADQGRLDLDQPIVEYIPDLHFDDPLGETLTLRDLLGNTAGFAPDDTGWYSGQQDTLADVVAAAQHQPFTGTPGETSPTTTWAMRWRAMWFKRSAVNRGLTI